MGICEEAPFSRERGLLLCDGRDTGDGYSGLLTKNNFCVYTEITDKMNEGEIRMNHTKKMIAPVIIASLMLLYYIGVVLLFLFVGGIPLAVKLLMTLGPLAVCGVTIGVLISRIREIEGGEEDDLSKY